MCAVLRVGGREQVSTNVIILTTGKGGVGKTTMAAVTGAALAARGARTVVVSIDPAHSLADVFDRTLDDGVQRVAEGLDATEVRLSRELQARWGTIQAYLRRLLASQGVDDWLAEDIAYLPGLDEVAGLLRIAELRELYEHVVVDCPPTGSTLRYLNLPEAVEWYMRKFFPAERRIVQTLGPLAERVAGMPMPGRSVFDQVEDLFDGLLALRRTLTDPVSAVTQVVATPERVVLRETRRATGFLNIHGLPVGRLVLNRATSGADEAVALGIPEQLAVASQQGEPIGVEAIEVLAARLFADRDPLPKAPEEAPLRIERTADGASLVLRVPRVEDAPPKVGRRGDDLIVDWGPVRRHVPLPPGIAALELRRATWQDAGLTLEFRP